MRGKPCIHILEGLELPSTVAHIFQPGRRGDHGRLGLRKYSPGKRGSVTMLVPFVLELSVLWVMVGFRILMSAVDWWVYRGGGVMVIVISVAESNELGRWGSRVDLIRCSASRKFTKFFLSA